MSEGALQVPHVEALTLDALQSSLAGVLAPLAKGRGFGHLAPLGGPPQVADATTKATVHDRDGRRVCVLICSSPVAPGQVARGVSNARAGRALVGPEVGAVILEPLLVGDIAGVSYAAYPYCGPLASGRVPWALQRIRLAPSIFAWLHAVARTPHGEPGSAGEAFREALLGCASNGVLSEGVRRHARTAVDRLEAGEWKPRHRLDHNDLWKDNILLPAEGRTTGSAFPFTVIDWVGANVSGYGVYDLVRFARSLRSGPGVCRRELGRHATALGCQPVDLMGHLLASFGRLGRHLEAFPLERYVKAVEQCADWVREHTRGLP